MIRQALGALALVMTAVVANAQVYPDKPIRIVSPFPPGGGTDLLARTVGAKLHEINKWTVVVENKPGANGTMGLSEVARARPTGYELVLGQKDNLVLAPWLFKVSFDSVKDFTPIAMIGTTPVVILAAANSRYRSFADVVAAAKAAPNALSFATSGNGSVSHIASELLRSRANVHLQHVPYKGSGPALADLVGGHVDVAGSSIASAIPLIKGGKARALAVTGLSRNPSLPDVPSLAEFGITNVEVSSWWGLLGPANLPKDIVRRLNEDVNKLLVRADVLNTLKDNGIEAKQTTPEQFANILKTDYHDWEKVIAEIGIKLD
jgi:tripartite-type tricarboxylate transporter receptor subunit TctC